MAGEEKLQHSGGEGNWKKLVTFTHSFDRVTWTHTGSATTCGRSCWTTLSSRTNQKWRRSRRSRSSPATANVSGKSFEGYLHQTQIGIRPELTKRIDVETNASDSAEKPDHTERGSRLACKSFDLAWKILWSCLCVVWTLKFPTTASILRGAAVGTRPLFSVRVSCLLFTLVSSMSTDLKVCVPPPPFSCPPQQSRPFSAVLKNKLNWHTPLVWRFGKAHHISIPLARGLAKTR